MSIVSDGTGDWGRATLSGIVNAGQLLFIGSWVKWNNAITSGYLLSLYAGGASPGVSIELASASFFRTQVNAANAANNGAPVNATWQQLSMVYGPWTGTAQTRRSWLNGTQMATGTLSATSSSADLTRLTFFGNNATTPTAQTAGKLGHVIVLPVADMAAADALAVLLATQAVTATALGFTPAWSRTLDTDLTTGHGTGDPALTNATTDSGDNPPVSYTAIAAAAVQRIRRRMVGV